MNVTCDDSTLEGLYMAMPETELVIAEIRRSTEALLQALAELGQSGTYCVIDQILKEYQGGHKDSAGDPE